MIHICHIRYVRKVQVALLAVGSDELGVGNNKLDVGDSKVASFGGCRGGETRKQKA